jgi:diadenosine tetraphosphatase ApaH/serine/threonine PP2A family protein phosphatase
LKLILFSDLHSNFAALEACLTHMRGTPHDRICMLGDMIAYGPRPKECVEAMRRLEREGALCLKGNHDDNSVRQGLPGGVSAEVGRYELWDREGMGQDNLDWVGSLPAMVQWRDMLFVHASPREPMREYVDDEASCRQALNFNPSRWIFCGHSHRPLCYSLFESGASRLHWPEGEEELRLDPDARHLINVGSVGESRDGDPRACYVVLDTERCVLQFKRVNYDVMLLVDDMRKQGFPEALWRKRLPSGKT